MEYLLNGSTDPYFNMAHDEYCLENLPLRKPVFYLWQNRPSVIIGQNQNAYTEVNLRYLEDNGIALARRVTGGGAVYHDLQNLNFTIMGRAQQLEDEDPEYAQTLAACLRTLGVDAQISGRNDILVGGRKISGFAKRVWKDRILVHGTLMYDVDLEKLSKALDCPESKLHAAGIASVKSRVANLKDLLPWIKDISHLKACLQEIMAGRDSLIEINATPVEELAKTKFATWEWIYGRSPAAGFERRLRLACGTVQAICSVDKGKLTGLEFGGDFLGGLPSEELAAKLIGCRYEKNALLEALKGLNVGAYFDSVGPQELIRVLI